jgi:hypothetical protein
MIAAEDAKKRMLSEAAAKAAKNRPKHQGDLFKDNPLFNAQEYALAGGDSQNSQ